MRHILATHKIRVVTDLKHEGSGKCISYQHCKNKGRPQRDGHPYSALWHIQAGPITFLCDC